MTSMFSAAVTIIILTVLYVFDIKQKAKELTKMTNGYIEMREHLNNRFEELQHATEEANTARDRYLALYQKATSSSDESLSDT